ncbi:MAG: hypothetical protein ACJ75B_21870 [Flavisolibacter sp.]
MKLLNVIGIGLILLGIAMLAAGGFSFKEKKKILDTDSVDVTTKQTKTITWPPIVGTIVIVGGVIILLANRGRKNSV